MMHYVLWWRITIKMEKKFNNDKLKLATRYNEGKLRWRNIPLFFVKPLVEVGQKGEKKYGTYNFLKGSPALDTYDSLMRHLNKFMDPNQSDYDEVDDDGKPGTGCHHMALVAWNALYLLYSIISKPELDDRYKVDVDDSNMG